MTSEREFDAQLRSWLEESAPSGQPQGLLESVVTATAHTRPRPPWLVRLRGAQMLEAGRPGQYRFAPLALAATAIVVAILIGISLLVRAPNVGPSPIPGPTHSSTLESSSPPGPTDSAPAWAETGGMIESRGYGYPATLLLDGRVLVAGGSSVDGGGDLTSAELYDPISGTWSATGNMIEAPYLHTATLLRDGTVLVAGGGERRGGHAELYDPSSGTWTATGDMIVVIRASQTATLLPDGRVLVTGVSASSEEPFASSAELYDPSTGSWTATGSMIEPRYAYAATRLINGKVLVAGGDVRGGRLLTSAELYDPSTGSWTATGSTIEAHDVGHIATLLRDGRVLVAGGYNSLEPDPLDPMTSAELYDPSTGSWTATGSMIEAHQTATLLANGTVLVAGGPGSNGEPLASAELYDPISGTWSATGNMIEAPYLHTATLLLDGRVLVTGNRITSDGIWLALAELYDPGGGT